MPRSDDDDRDRPLRPAGPSVALIVGLIGVGCGGLTVLAVVAVGLFGFGAVPWPDRDDPPVGPVQQAPTVPAPQPADTLPPGQQELTVTDVQRSRGGDGVKLLVFYDLPAGELTGDLFVVVKRAAGTTSRLPVRKGFRKAELPGATFNRGSVELAEGWGGDGFREPFDVWVERGGDDATPGARISNTHTFR